MKKRLIAGIVLLLAMVCLCAHAFADTDPIKVSIELSETKFAEPKEITVFIQVTNTSEADMPGPVTLYYPNGKQIDEFGAPTLTAGQSKSYSYTWQVTQSHLDSGKLVFPVKYKMYNDAGELINKTKNMTVLFTYTGAVASVEINRTIAPTTAGRGQKVSITYDVVNSGNIDITDVTIKENSSISSKTGAIDAIAAGEKASYTFTVTMGTRISPASPPSPTRPTARRRPRRRKPQPSSMARSTCRARCPLTRRAASWATRRPSPCR